MEGLLFSIFLFGLTIGMVILSTRLPWLLGRVIAFVLMILTGFLVAIHLFSVEIEKMLLMFAHLNTIETIFIVGYSIVNVAVIGYYFYDKTKENGGVSNNENKT